MEDLQVGDYVRLKDSQYRIYGKSLPAIGRLTREMDHSWEGYKFEVTWIRSDEWNFIDHKSIPHVDRLEKLSEADVILILLTGKSGK